LEGFWFVNKKGLGLNGADFEVCKGLDIDPIIDKYEVSVKEPKDFEFLKEEREVGSVIGSSFFKFQFFEGRKKERRVPRE
jgi:hypothetical protein